MTPIPFREQNITYNPPLLSTLLAFTAHAAGHSSAGPTGRSAR